MKLINQLCTGLFIVALSGGHFAVAAERAVNTEIIKKTDIENLVEHSNHVYSGAQPNAEQIKLLSQAGVKHVINLRAFSEQTWDEGELVRSLGMNYHTLPIAGAKDVTVENALNLTNLLNEFKGESILVHCASSNRVGALIAISAHEQGLDVEAALDKGKRWGMKSLEPVVREVINDK
ncbi:MULTISPECIES: fused DSP-PTPase phosphatase/NAD kinase-like protein [Pseudoalteromonas]|uniref:DSP-PTPase phosphatase fused to NAD+ Kinase domain-containing protein n=1 Tax=Pseudoalteromonas arctica A 37-1-2 TaxID=1117313 RepID=A0A290S3I9_9GAMM|nr:MULTISPECIES: hypothetical protein [Pseudoalteromonas]ATC85561.1 hypothetical protein PARC_a0874 [Pseudoalteromonas arctica A 37-1-2]MBH0002960.1 hypothetical protein [Pseudoalteromonas sp. SWYJZ12]MBZ2192352.1 hypothetical protein [Pseudoalteromonas arctica]